MNLNDRLNKMTINELHELKGIVDSIANAYAEKLTDYALISGDNMLSKIPKEKAEMYQKRQKYKESSSLIQSILIKKVDDILCSKD